MKSTHHTTLRRLRRPLHASLAVLAVACAPDAPPREAPASVPFTELGDVRQLMIRVVEPAAETYWDAVGTIVDADGVHEIRPQSDEEWEAVVHAAYVLAESGNLLMMPGRVPDREGWVGMSQAMTEVSQRAIAAAESRDEQAVFDAGAEVYYTCSGCHVQYAPETLRPSAADDPAKSNSGG